MLRNPYRNRLDPHVMRRNMAKSRQWAVEHFGQKRKQLEADAAQAGDGHHLSPVDAHRAKRRRRQKQKQVERVVRESAAHDQRLSMLKPGKIASIIVLNQLNGRAVEVFDHSSDRCRQCSTTRYPAFDPETYRSTCPGCGETWHILSIVEDTVSDNLLFRSQEKSAKDKLKSTTMCVFGDSQSPGDRSPMYARYLAQFSADAPTIPITVLQTVLTHIGPAYLTPNGRCRPTPVATVLREAMLPKWVAFAARITQHLNGAVVPKLSPGLVKNLVRRFKIIGLVADDDTMAKLPPLSTITHVLLRMEKQPALANAFESHKTPSVLNSVEAKLRSVIPGCQAMAPDMDWSLPRLF